MKKELKKALDHLLGEAVEGLGYTRLRKPAVSISTLYPGEVVFEREVTPGLRRWVSFVPDQRRHAFNIELGWSAIEGVAVLSMRPTASPQAAIAERHRVGFVRLVELYDPRGRDWDLFPLDSNTPQAFEAFLRFEMHKPSAEEACTMLTPLVEDAVNKLRVHGDRFFSELETVIGSSSR